MKDIKVIYLLQSLSPTDGYSRYSLDFISQIRGQIKSVAICNKENATVNFIRQISLLRPSHHYFINPLLVLIDLLKIRRAVKEEIDSNCDNYIHFTAEGYSLFLPFLCGLNLKSIITVHGTYSVLPLKKLRTAWLFRCAYSRANRILSVSNFTKRHLLNNAKFINPDKIKVITNGVRFVNHSLPNRLDHKICTIICVGEVKPRKGAHNLIEVARELADRNFSFKILIIGAYNPQSSYYVELRGKISEYQLDDVVSFAGKVPQDRLEEIYRKADIFALLSVNESYHYEGYPLVFHEAAMWGLPTIGSNNCGAEDAILNLKTGILVNPDDHRDIALKIIDICSGTVKIDPYFCQEWARNNDWSNKNLLAVYKELQ